MLDSVDANASHTELRGRRVHLRLQAKETGKLTSAVDVIADLDLEAANGLVALLQSAIDQARTQRAAPESGAIYIRKPKP
jgi:hypothetical protein